VPVRGLLSVAVPVGLMAGAVRLFESNPPQGNLADFCYHYVGTTPPVGIVGVYVAVGFFIFPASVVLLTVGVSLVDGTRARWRARMARRPWWTRGRTP